MYIIIKVLTVLVAIFLIATITVQTPKSELVKVPALINKSFKSRTSNSLAVKSTWVFGALLASLIVFGQLI